MQPPIINSKRPDGQIGDGVYVAYQWREGHEIVTMWIGTRQGGPILQWTANGADLWDGAVRREFPGGAWTPLYSRGNYGRNYACGGNWASQTLNRLGQASPRKDVTTELLVVEHEIVPLPSGLKGVQGDITQIDMDCSKGWSIFYDTAGEALRARLPHTESPETIAAVFEVLAAHGLNACEV